MSTHNHLSNAGRLCEVRHLAPVLIAIRFDNASRQVHGSLRHPITGMVPIWQTRLTAGDPDLAPHGYELGTFCMAALTQPEDAGKVPGVLPPGWVAPHPRQEPAHAAPYHHNLAVIAVYRALDAGPRRPPGPAGGRPALGSDGDIAQVGACWVRDIALPVGWCGNAGPGCTNGLRSGREIGELGSRLGRDRELDRCRSAAAESAIHLRESRPRNRTACGVRAPGDRGHPDAR
jgi:hypothetical protein